MKLQNIMRAGSWERATGDEMSDTGRERARKGQKSWPLQQLVIRTSLPHNEGETQGHEVYATEEQHSEVEGGGRWERGCVNWRSARL